MYFSASVSRLELDCIRWEHMQRWAYRIPHVRHHQPNFALRQWQDNCYHKHSKRRTSRALTCRCRASVGEERLDGGSDLRWSSWCSDQPIFSAAMEEAIQGALRGLGPDAPGPDTAMVYLSGAHGNYDVAMGVVDILRARLPSLQNIVGTSAYGVLGDWQEGPLEVEGKAGVSLALACLSGVQVSVLHLPMGALPDADAAPDVWWRLLGLSPPSPATPLSFFILGSPDYTDLAALLQGLDFACPQASKLGGLSSGQRQRVRRKEGGEFKEAFFGWPSICWSAGRAMPSTHGVVMGGCSILVTCGRLLVEPIIAQGCRPLSGQVYQVTQLKERSIIFELAATGAAGREQRLTPIMALERDLASLPASERQSAGLNLTVAIAPDNFKASEDLGPQDFVIRALVGASPETGALAIGEALRVGQRIRFMVRDRQGACQDLQAHGIDYKRRQLQAQMEGTPVARAFGTVIFSCNGRGINLYQEPNYDSRTVKEFLPIPTCGFFCAGEIGQVGSTTYLHGFTCVVGILRDAASLPAQETDAAASIP
eukprot:jgi/Botrbrau1/15620/Bobra.4_1s0008.1